MRLVGVGGEGDEDGEGGGGAASRMQGFKSDPVLLSPASAMPASSLVSLIWIDQERNTKEASFWVSDQNIPGVFLDLFTHKFF